MIVFPQTFNYRLIISSLAVALVVIGLYSLYNYNKLDTYKTYIHQEKKLLENELSEMINRFEEVEVENTSINQKLETSKARIESALDSIKALKANVTLLTVYRSKIKVLQKEKEAVFKLVENLQLENQKLSDKAKLAQAELIGNQNLTKSLKLKNEGLAEANSNLSEKIVNASQLEVENLSAKAVKRINGNRMYTTDDSKRAKRLFVEFTIAKNKFANEGEKNLYVQILNPNNNVVSDQGAANFGKQSLIFSEKIKVDYKNQDVNVKSLIQTDKDEPLTKGVYFVNVFNDDKRLGSTSITLK